MSCTRKYSGGDGNDLVNARNGKKETVDCGAGKKDSATVDKADNTKGREKSSSRRSRPPRAASHDCPSMPVTAALDAWLLHKPN